MNKHYMQILPTESQLQYFHHNCNILLPIYCVEIAEWSSSHEVMSLV